MADSEKTTSKSRLYYVLEQINAGDDGEQLQTFQLIARVTADDEKQARWAAVDGNSALKARVAGDEQVYLAAISDRNWALKETTEKVVEKKTRT